MGIKPIPVGNEDFRDIIEKNYYYVDKTLLIKELLEYKGYVNLFTRPRRFGKTLGVSMLQYFFEKTDADNEKLFHGLKIMSEAECLKHMGKYPVISISFKSGKQGSSELTFASIKKVIAEEYRRHEAVLLNSAVETERIRRIMNAEGGISDYIDALRFLTECLYKYYNEKVVVLIDEYDVPLENAYFKGFYDEVLDFMRAIFESALKTNPFLEFAVITGCLRISRESIFTGLNNLEIISITSKLYAEYFGFTKSEVADLLQYYHLEDKSEELKRWYDGYSFGKSEVYNPWSVVNYVKNAWLDNTSFPRPYWSNTSSNDIVRKLIDQSDLTVKQEIESLISGNTIEKPIHEDILKSIPLWHEKIARKVEITYGDLENSTDNIWNFLFFTGYLKSEGERVNNDDGTRFISLRIPNLEVMHIYKSKIREWFQEKVQSRDFKVLYQSILQNDVHTFEKELSVLLRESISYYDNKEAFYHGFLLGILQGMKEFTIDSNKESGDGRYDLMLRSLDVEIPAAVMELKTADKFADLDKRAEDALLQIMDRNYGEKLKQDGYQKILYYGIAFYKKNCRIINMESLHDD